MVEALGAPADTAERLGTFLKLLADPTRRRVFLLLMRGETCNCEMTGLLGLPQNLISHHLRALREAGLIRSRRDERDARWIYYRVDPDVLEGVCHDFQAVFSPDQVSRREPRCGPLLKDCVS
jgi:ArsR family transcriptional regulator, arsenate/arsenite/antimonite-responsive transcriptional repressor